MNIRRLEQRETTGPNKSVISFSHSHSGTSYSHLSTLGIEPFEGHVRMEENIEQLRRDRMKEAVDKFPEAYRMKKYRESKDGLSTRTKRHPSHG
jgi:hypothetical protein